ncbi:hypothetical protein M0P65_07890 [Candidatus Gracilibacteria bacterium]|jgi:rubrerythrin|nr:hypothetical protein [Candidatus Gracilibacteria bacterium]
MRIKEITSQNRRDFQAIYECEHCGFTERDYGYDDTYFHQTVIPNKVCPQCGKKAGENYRPLVTKYPDWVEI